jgi:hypothetical protein
MEIPKKFFTPQVAKYVINNATIFLALLSGYMYVCAYTYEQAYLKEFGVSSAHLNLDINTILRDATRIIGIIVLVTGSYQLLLRIFHPLLSRSKKHREIIQTIVVLFIVLMSAWVYFPVNNYLFLYVFAIVGIVYIFIVLSITLKNIVQKTGIRKNDNIFSDDKQIYYGFNKYYIYVFLFIINPIFICQILGQGEAFRQHSFEVIHDSVNRVIIRKYGDEIICKGITKTNQIDNKITLINLNGSKVVDVTNMEVGYISLSNVSESNFAIYLRKHWL